MEKLPARFSSGKALCNSLTPYDFSQSNFSISSMTSFFFDLGPGVTIFHTNVTALHNSVTLKQSRLIYIMEAKMVDDTKLRFDQSRLIRLTLWTEVVGTFRGLHSNDSNTYVKIEDKVLVFPRNSLESKIIQRRLLSSLVGLKIGILRCDELMRPILVRTLNQRIEKCPKSTPDSTTQQP